MSEDRLDDRAEELLGRVVAGELSPEDAEVVERAAGDAEFRAALEDAVELRRALDRSARDEVRARDEARAEVRPEDRERVRGFIDAQVRSEGPGASATRPLARLVLVLAAAVVAVVLLIPDEEPGPSGSGPLGEVPEERAFPVGSVTRIDHFRAPEEPQVGGAVEFSVHADARADEAILRKRVEGAARWELTPEEIERVPRSLYWRYVILDGTNTPVASGGFEATIDG